MNAKKILEKLKTDHNFSTLQPVSKIKVETTTENLKLSKEFTEFYLSCNGLTHEWFRVLPIFDTENPKSTWDSIERANNASESKFQLDSDFLSRFSVFAEIGAGECAIFDKADGAIWYEENGDFHRTTLDLFEFIETCLREVDEI